MFSAPKYCDSTENKGAYINIDPTYKLDFHKFDAVPHPDIKPMVCRPHTLPPFAYPPIHRTLVLTNCPCLGLCPITTHVHDVENPQLSSLRYGIRWPPTTSCRKSIYISQPRKYEGWIKWNSKSLKADHRQQTTLTAIHNLFFDLVLRHLAVT